MTRTFPVFFRGLCKQEHPVLPCGGSPGYDQGVGALTTPFYLGDRKVLSGDVVCFRPRGVMAFLRRPFLAVVDVRDRSVPYLVRRQGRRVMKIPFDGASYLDSRWEATIYRIPGIDRGRGSTVAACAAERPGEGIHHPDYDCGRMIESDGELIAEAYRSIEVEVQVRDGVPGPPLQRVGDEGGAEDANPS